VTGQLEDTPWVSTWAGALAPTVRPDPGVVTRRPLRKALTLWADLRRVRCTLHGRVVYRCPTCMHQINL
jgi:hypothetical protein